MNLITLILKLYSDGLNSYQIHRVLIRFKNSLPSMESAVIPSRRYISDLRLSMDCLNKYRELEFVQNAKTLTLSMDESPSSKGDKSFQNHFIIRNSVWNLKYSVVNSEILTMCV